MSAIINVYSLFLLLGDLRRVLVAMATTTMATGYQGHNLTRALPTLKVLPFILSTAHLSLSTIKSLFTNLHSKSICFEVCDVRMKPLPRSKQITIATGMTTLSVIGREG